MMGWISRLLNGFITSEEEEFDSGCSLSTNYSDMQLKVKRRREAGSGGTASGEKQEVPNADQCSKSKSRAKVTKTTEASSVLSKVRAKVTKTTEASSVLSKCRAKVTKATEASSVLSKGRAKVTKTTEASSVLSKGHVKVTKTMEASSVLSKGRAKVTKTTEASSVLSKGHAKVTKTTETSSVLSNGSAKVTKTTEASSVLSKMTLVDSVKSENKMKVKRGKGQGHSQQTATVLLDWIIKPLPDIRGVCVEGQKQGTENFWHSTAIVDTLRPKLVVTATGSQYKLRGRINKLCTIDNGFSKSVAKAFANGFPKSWKQTIHEFYSQLEDSISILENSSPVVSKKGLKLVSEGRRRKTAASSKNMKLIGAPGESDSILTPNGIVNQKISTGDVIVTRSGRMSLPPLAGWMGQQYRKLPGSNQIEVIFETECAKKFLNKMTSQLLQLPKRSLKMVMSSNKTLSNSMLLTNKTAKVGGKKANKTIDCLDNRTIASLADVPPEKAPKTIVCLDNVAVVSLADVPPEKALKTIVCLDNVAGVSPADVPPEKALKTIVCLDNVAGVSPADVPPEKAPKTIVCLDNVAGVSPADVPPEKALKTKQRLVGGTDSRSPVTAQDGHASEIVCKDLRVALCPLPLAANRSRSSQSPSVSDSLHKSLQEEKICKYTQNNCSVEVSSNGRSNLSSVGSSNGRSNLSSIVSSNGRSNLSSVVSSNGRSNLSSIVSSNGRSNLSSIVGSNGRSNLSSIVGSNGRSNLSSIVGSNGRSNLSSIGTQIHSAAPSMTRSWQERSSLRSVKRRKITLDNSDVWSEQEKELLQRALTEVNGAQTNYWEKVSEMVGTRSEFECQQTYRQLMEKQLHKKSPPRSHPKIKKKNGRQKGEPIRGGKGTLKRKQDLRDFLEEQNDGYEDNIFDGTPFAGRKMVSSVFAVNDELNDSEIFGTNHSCITPGLNSTPGMLPRARMASVRKTPTHVNALRYEDTPVSINRRRADQYMKTYIDRKKKAGAGQTLAQVDSNVLRLSTLPVKSLLCADNMPSSTLPVKSLFCPDNLPSITVDNDEDDPSPYMYYWNDDSSDS